MEEQKKILVLCGGKFAFRSLQILAFEKFLCGIGIGKGAETIVDGFERLCADSGIGFRSFPDRDSVNDLRSWIDDLQPDYIFSISFPFLVPQDALAYGEDRFINFHPGPLPGYRGPMPIFEVLRYGEPETAISVHHMSGDFDSGSVIFSDPVRIPSNSTYGQLAVELSDRMAQVVQNTANMLQFASTVPSVAQDEASARYFEQPQDEDTRIDWKRMPAEEIVSLINACNPWNSGADTTLMGENAKIISASLGKERHGKLPGTVLRLNDEGMLCVACTGDQQLLINLLSTDLGILSARQLIGLNPLIIGQCFN